MAAVINDLYVDISQLPTIKPIDECVDDSPLDIS